MTRIFLTLASLSVLLLCANILLGLGIGDYNGRFDAQNEVNVHLAELDRRVEELKQQRPRPVAEIDKLREEMQAQLQAGETSFAPMRSRAFVHMMFGIVAALVTLLVNCICVTYFIGTGRWVREVVETYDFPTSFIAECNAIKRRTFPWALVGMFTVLGIIALGQAANPGIIRDGTAAWVTPHLLGAMAGTALIAFAYYRQATNIAANYEVIGRIVARVEEVRREKGLDDVESESSTKPEIVTG